MHSDVICYYIVKRDSVRVIKMTTTIKAEAEELFACRICLATETKLFGIFELGLEGYFAELMGTQLALWDGMPQHLCCWCVTQLRRAARLRARCRRARDLLQATLLQHHYVTTDFVRTIDRVSNQLTLHLTTDKLAEPLKLKHNENIKINVYLPDNDISDDDDNKEDDVFLKDIAEPTVEIIEDKLLLRRLNIDKVNSDSVEVKEKPKTKAVKSAKTVKVRKVKRKVKKVDKREAKEKRVDEEYKRSKKGFKRFFSCEEDYVKFENTYNITIVKVSEDEQRREVAARRQSANYARAHVRCDKCYKGFLSEATFENHLKVHDPNMGANECHLCLARFKHPTRLRRHMETHSLKFVCKLCPLVTRHRGMAMMHSDFHSGKTFECKYCGLTFKKKTTFNTHIRVQHPLENASGGTCDVCGETFIGKRGLQQHKTMAHRRLPIPELKCSECRVQFENLDAVVRHMNDSSDKMCNPDLRACPQCGETFASADGLASHARDAHVPQTHKCDDCDKSFATRSSLCTHVDRVHLKIKPKKLAHYKHHLYDKKTTKRIEEICEICGKGYPSATWLKYHQRTHTGERPYKCTECPKSYMTPAALHSHSVSHTGVRRWQCSQCPKTFLHQSSIYKHKLVHTGEKPFECNICNKTFTQSGSLATHVKYVHLKVKPPPRRRRRDATT